MNLIFEFLGLKSELTGINKAGLNPTNLETQKPVLFMSENSIIKTYLIPISLKHRLQGNLIPTTMETLKNRLAVLRSAPEKFINPLNEDLDLQEALFLSHLQSKSDEISRKALEQSIDDEMERMRIFHEMEKQKMEYECLEWEESYNEDEYVSFWEVDD